MSTGPHRARQHSTSGVGLVVSGGACAPDTKRDYDIFAIDNKCYDSYESAIPTFLPLCHLPLVVLGHVTPWPRTGIGWYLRGRSGYRLSWGRSPSPMPQSTCHQTHHGLVV
ncbi:hypothetical protein CYMTET_7653 [Cymbomonas tetramitiformis]|uniref:Uncharacterized protein n=1 Tax=Cymbomonas tetramitiformis TaxID=36881 RepID=A0AAE0LHA2_9CHLO|nr:hypothetical protein CYMTET_7653 [Cymbomonas tetramitiformis]